MPLKSNNVGQNMIINICKKKGKINDFILLKLYYYVGFF